MNQLRFTTVMVFWFGVLIASTLVHADTYYVDPVGGSDSNNGTSELTAFQTIEQVRTVIDAGDTVILRGTGHYPPATFDHLKWTGSSSSRITVKSKTGETAVFDPGYPAYKTAFNSAWVPYTGPGAAPGEYVSTADYTSNDVARYMMGMFLDPTTLQATAKLMTYSRLEDLRAANESEVVVPVSDTRPRGGHLKGDSAHAHPWCYRGPGIWWDSNPNATDKKIHIRLATTHFNSPGVTDYVSTPSSTTPTDPRTVPLSICLDTATPAVVSGNYIDFQNIVFQCGGKKSFQVEKEPGVTSGTHITADHCSFFGGRYVVQIASTKWMKFEHCIFDGKLPSYCARGDTKDEYTYVDSGTGQDVVNELCGVTNDALFASGTYDDEDLEIAYCEFRNGHDGMTLFGVRPRIHHNLFENINDEVFYTDGANDGVDDIRIYNNVIRKALNVFSHAAGGAAATGARYYYRNIVDLRIPTLGFRTFSPDPPNAGYTGNWRPSIDFKMNAVVNQFYCYQNTFIQGNPDLTQELTKWTGDADVVNPKTRRFMNNIHMSLQADKPLHIIPNPSYPALSDGNDWCRRMTNAVSPLYVHYDLTTTYADYSALSASALWSSYLSANGVGWDTHSRFDYPQFANVSDHAYAHSVAYPNADYRLKSSSPVRGVGATLLNTWPDSETYDSTPDIGALPYGAAAVAVGVDGARLFPDNSTPIAEAGDYSVVSDSDGDGFETITLTANGSTDPNGTITTYAWVLNGVTISTSYGFSIAVPPGTYQFYLTVTDNSGKQATDMREVTVTDPNPHANLLANPGFEDGTTGWDSNGGESAVASPVHYGAKALRQQGAITYRALTQVVPIAPGASVKASGWIKTVSLPSGSHVAYQVTWLDSGLTTISTMNVAINIAGTTDWTYYSATGTSPTNAVYAHVGLYMDSGAGSFDVY